MADKKTKYFSTVAIFLYLICSVFCSAHNNPEQNRKSEFSIGYMLTVAPAGLLRDITNTMPSFCMNMNYVNYICNTDIAFRSRIGFHTWYDTHHLRGTDSHRTQVNSSVGSLGLMYFLNNGHDSNYRNYFCFEAGVTRWSINSSTFPPLDNSRYFKPMGGFYFGTENREIYMEFGLNINFLETNTIDFKKYSTPDISLAAGFGFKW